MLLSCSVYPQTILPLRTLPAGVNADPSPPSDLLFICFEGAVIPPRTSDGRVWDKADAKPSPLAKLMVDGKELFSTPSQPDTLEPTWPNQPRANYRVSEDAEIKAELWDSRALGNRAICITTIPQLHEYAARGEVIEAHCAAGGRINLRVEPAHGKLGLGFNYEFRSAEAIVTKVYKESPAGREGLQAGDRITEIMGKTLEQLSEPQARSLFNANAATGVKFKVQRAGKTLELDFKDGPIYLDQNEGKAE